MWHDHRHPRAKALASTRESLAVIAVDAVINPCARCSGAILARQAIAPRALKQCTGEQFSNLSQMDRLKRRESSRENWRSVARRQVRVGWAQQQELE